MTVSGCWHEFLDHRKSPPGTAAASLSLFSTNMRKALWRVAVLATAGLRITGILYVHYFWIVRDQIYAETEGRTWCGVWDHLETLVYQVLFTAYLVVRAYLAVGVLF